MNCYPLYPSRQVLCLDGLWDFAFLGEAVDLDRIDTGKIQFDQRICVPSAFDAMPPWAGKRGTAAYRLLVPATPGRQALLKFHGLGMWARVLVDGVTRYEGAYPYSGFSVELPATARASREIVVLVDNRFDFMRVPLQEQYFDFYAYGGIFRSVEYLEVPATRIDRVRISVEDLAQGTVALRVLMAGSPQAKLEFLVGFDGGALEPLPFQASADGSWTAQATLADKTPWSPEQPRLHTVRVAIAASDGSAGDCIEERFGLRTVEARQGQVLLNGKPIQLRGYCRHEASLPYGPALPLVQLVQDMHYLKDLGCNFVRGSHYPQDPRWLDLCDENGMLVFEESLSWQAREQHFADAAFCQQQIDQTRMMVANSFNHPSIIIWGFLNEGLSNLPASRALYQGLAAAIREEDRSRLVTFASMMPFDDINFDLVDLISVNQYPGWYPQDRETVRPLGEIGPLLDRLTASLKARGLEHKPVLVSEIGAGAIYGWRDPLNAHWTEDYQSDYLAEACTQILGRAEYCGVSLWQFCDCRTYASGHALGRPRGINDKGTLDEYRRPKMGYRTVKGIFGKAAE